MNELDEYWTRRVEIGRLPLPIEGEQDVSLVWHQAIESCERNYKEIGLRQMAGEVERVYVHVRACYFTPEITVTIGIVGEDVQPRGSIRHEFANLQAWFYPDVGALMLWEVDVWRPREADPRADFILACLWDGFERELLRVFPDAREIITPSEPNYPNEQWAAFLAERGYAPHVENTYRKALKSGEAELKGD